MSQVYNQKNDSSPSLPYHALLDPEAESTGRKGNFTRKSSHFAFPKHAYILRFLTAAFGGIFVVTLIIAGIWSTSQFKPRTMFTPESQ
jgi:hypothetical protein